MELRKIIVVTPVKNEDWIIRTFLEVTSCFADAILIADQQSSDDTLKIAATFEKVIVLNNQSKEYRESERQAFLIEKARELYPGNHLIIALDADEIASADSLNSVYWNNLRNLASGTLLYFRKTDLVNKGTQTPDIHDTFYPLGFADDGKLKHNGKLIHSIRIPMGDHNQPCYYDPAIIFLHLQWLRPKTQEAKRRFYQVKERDFGTIPWYWRRKRYKKAEFLGQNLPLKPTPLQWLTFPEALKVEIASLKESPESWFDTEVYHQLLQKGGRTYWLDDIWDKDWNNFKQDGKKVIHLQPKWLHYLLRVSDIIFNSIYHLKQKFNSLKK